MNKKLTDIDNCNCHEIASILSLNLSTVRRWIQRGWLKAKGRAPKHYQIRTWHLEQFLENPPQQIKKRIAALDTKSINYLLRGKA
jgi:transposase